MKASAAPVHTATAKPKWRPWELAVLRVTGATVLLGALVLVSAMYVHRHAVAAQEFVWRGWIEAECASGDLVRCGRQADYTNETGMPNAAFWSHHADLADQAGCMARRGILTADVPDQAHAAACAPTLIAATTAR